MNTRFCFYTIDKEYVDYLRQAETVSRGFSRVPSLDYAEASKRKFFCGIVLRRNGLDYFVPVSSNKVKRQNNIIIRDKKGKPLSSLRFNYMIPAPKTTLTYIDFSSEPDKAYRSLLYVELRFCNAHQEAIYAAASKTYNKVLSHQDSILNENSCDFKLLESACLKWINSKDMKKTAPAPSPEQTAPVPSDTDRKEVTDRPHFFDQEEGKRSIRKFFSDVEQYRKEKQARESGSFERPGRDPSDPER